MLKRVCGAPQAGAPGGGPAGPSSARDPACRGRGPARQPNPAARVRSCGLCALGSARRCRRPAAANPWPPGAWAQGGLQHTCRARPAQRRRAAARSHGACSTESSGRAERAAQRTRRAWPASQLPSGGGAGQRPWQRAGRRQLHGRARTGVNRCPGRQPCCQRRGSTALARAAAAAAGHPGPGSCAGRQHCAGRAGAAAALRRRARAQRTGCRRPSALQQLGGAKNLRCRRTPARRARRDRRGAHASGWSGGGRRLWAQQVGMQPLGGLAGARAWPRSLARRSGRRHQRARRAPRAARVGRHGRGAGHRPPQGPCLPCAQPHPCPWPAGDPGRRAAQARRAAAARARGSAARRRGGQQSRACARTGPRRPGALARGLARALAAAAGQRPPGRTRPWLGCCQRR